MKTRINKIDDIKKENPFTVPENYFAKLNEEIMSKLPEKEVVAPKKVTMWERTRPFVYLAAMFLGLFFIIQTLTHNTNKQQFADEYWSNVQITEEEFHQYLEDQLIEQGYYDNMYKQIQLN